MTVAGRDAGPAGLVPDAARGLPGQARGAPTNVEGVGQVEAAAEHEAATQPDETVEKICVLRQPASAREALPTAGSDDVGGQPNVGARIDGEEAEAGERVGMAPAAGCQGIGPAQCPQAAAQRGLRAG